MFSINPAFICVVEDKLDISCCTFEIKMFAFSFDISQIFPYHSFLQLHVGSPATIVQVASFLHISGVHVLANNYNN